jgi:hypothetical protein
MEEEAWLTKNQLSNNTGQNQDCQLLRIILLILTDRSKEFNQGNLRD